MSFNDELNSLRKDFPKLNIPNGKEAVVVSVYNIYKHHNIKPTEKILRFALNTSLKPKNYNDYYYLATIAFLRSNGIKKVAYPIGQGALSDELEEAFDIEKWSELVYKIYDAVQSGDMTYHYALDYYSGDLDTSRQEDSKFRDWVKYYKNGEHLKYDVRASRRNEMKKKADFQFPLSGSGFYTPDTKPIQKERLESEVKKDEFDEWKNKLYIAIRRLDKLLRQGDLHMSADVHSDLADLLHAFDMEVRRVRMASTASDMTKRAALAFKINGLHEHAETLYSLAQEAPVAEIDPAPDMLDEEPIGGTLGDEPEEFSEATTETPMQDDNAVTSVGDALQSGSGPKPGEYEVLGGDITLEIASAKLEEIAGTLADRRIVRLLAEFDIMLDKLGVAPMFPELAEAQSKLIDSYSYAITRVTKMLGMLSSGKSISEISGAKERELQKNVEKEVAKTFNPEEDEAPKGTEAINEEFGEAGPKTPAPIREDAPKPSPAPPVAKEV